MALQNNIDGLQWYELSERLRTAVCHRWRLRYVNVGGCGRTVFVCHVIDGQRFDWPPCKKKYRKMRKIKRLQTYTSTFSCLV